MLLRWIILASYFDMIILLSPAKIIDIERTGNLPFTSIPQFGDDASAIMASITQYSAAELSEIFKVNPTMASRILKNAYAFDSEGEPAKSAILAYNGVAFKKLQADTFSNDDFKYAQEHLIIASGIYGILRPLDIIKPYRMDFLSKIDGFGRNMRDYWKKKITQKLMERLKGDDEILINLASDEIYKSFDLPLIRKSAHIVDVNFLESKNQKYRSVPSTLAKQARGSMARFIIKNRINTINELQNFCELNMTFYPDLSGEREMTFLYR